MTDGTNDARRVSVLRELSEVLRRYELSATDAISACLAMASMVAKAQGVSTDRLMSMLAQAYNAVQRLDPRVRAKA